MYVYIYIHTNTYTHKNMCIYIYAVSPFGPNFAHWSGILATCGSSLQDQPLCLVGWTSRVYTYHEPPKPTFLEVSMVNNLVFRWPKPLFFMVLGAHGKGMLMCHLHVEATQAERVAQASVVGSHLGMKGEEGGDHPRTRKDTWLGSPPFKKSHEVRPFGRGPTTQPDPIRGQKRSAHGY